MITLRRYEAGPDGTRGLLTLPRGSTYQTLELPWRGNDHDVSCIPDGTYTLVRHVSPLIQRITGYNPDTGNGHRWTWMVAGVPHRSFVLLHPGNTIRDTDGCILPGNATGKLHDLPAVLNSRAAFEDIMRQLKDQETWQIRITWELKEYP